MFTKQLTIRPSRLSNKEHSFRPWLERLEERNAPSGHGHHGDGDDQGDNDQGHQPPPPPPPTYGINSSINAQGSFNHSTITDSFNNTVNVVVNQPSAQSSTQSGLMGISNLLSSALSNPQLGSLLNDEIALAVDNYLTGTPAIASVLGSTVVSDLKIDAANLTVAIAANPLESNPAGAAIGTMVYELTFHALTSAQSTI